MKEIKYELDKTDDNYSDWAIYYIRNLINEKLYIGSSVDYKSRLYTHYNKLNKGIHVNGHLQNAWNKYGEDNFEFGILEYIDPYIQDQEELRDIEQIYIDYFDVCNRNFGYNISQTATGYSHKHTEEVRKKMSESHKGRIVSEETKRKLSAIFKGRFVSEETRKKLSESHKGKSYMSEELKQKYSEMYSGEGNPFYGKTHSEEVKEKIRQNKLGQILNQNQLDALALGRGTKYWTEETYKKLSEAHRGENSGTSKLKEIDVIEILKLIKYKTSYKEISEKYNNISFSQISRIRHKKEWSYLYEKYPELYE